MSCRARVTVDVTLVSLVRVITRHLQMTQTGSRGYVFWSSIRVSVNL